MWTYVNIKFYFYFVTTLSPDVERKKRLNYIKRVKKSSPLYFNGRRKFTDVL